MLVHSATEVTGAGLVQNWEPLGLPSGCRGPGTESSFCTFPGKVLDWKWSNQDMNQCPYFLQTLQAAAYLAAPKHWVPFD